MVLVPEHTSIESAERESVAFKEWTTHRNSHEERARGVLSNSKASLNEDGLTLHQPHVALMRVREAHVVEAVDVWIAPECAILANTLCGGRRSGGRTWCPGALSVRANFQCTFVSDAYAIAVLKDNCAGEAAGAKCLPIGQEPYLLVKPAERLVLRALGHVTIRTTSRTIADLLAAHSLHIGHRCARNRLVPCPSIFICKLLSTEAHV
mmetsp:Transcript_47946/g.88221  ORF Transcript_47946/g.88221 Transcript_47946/m.88221 type:complete len:208 (-) Transcript_47946:1952-2575(-)